MPPSVNAAESTGTPRGTGWDGDTLTKTSNNADETAATIANAAVMLITLNWNGLGLPPQTWTAIVIAVAALLGALMSWLRHDWVYGLVLVWAFAGIAVKQAANPFVSTWAWGGLIFVLLAMIVGYVRKLRLPARAAL